MLKRTFWTIGKGKAIGYIESVKKEGYFWTHDSISFRNTISNLSNGAVVNMSITNLLRNEQNLQEQLQGCQSQLQQNLNKLMVERKPVVIEYKQEFFSNPSTNYILESDHVISIKEFVDETIRVKK